MPNRRILIIDDDLDIWKAYKAVLTPASLSKSGRHGDQLARLLESDKDLVPAPSQDFWLRFARQGQEGFGLVQEALEERLPYAVVFVDIRMPPGWDGMETARRIRDIDPEAEIVIVTAYSDHSREEIVRQVGSPEKLLFLRKPFDPEELFQIALSLSEKWTLGQQEKKRRYDLETVLHTTPVGIFTVNSSCQITSWNPEAERITGYPADEVVGRECILKKLSGRLCEKCLISNNDLSELNFAQSEFNIVDRDLKSKTIHKNISLVRDSQKHIVTAVESFWDITDQIETRQAIESSESRFRALVESSHDWIWEMDASGRFLYCSPVCQTIYGYHPEELLGRTIFDTLLPPDDAADFAKLLNNAITNCTGFKNVERRSITSDGKIIYIESSGSPILDDLGFVSGFHGIDRDITHRIRHEQEKALLEEQIRQSQKMEVLGTLAGGIAHDFNNILTPILVNTQVSMMELDKDSQLYRNLQEVRNSAEKASALIRQILAFSRKQAMLSLPLDLNGIISDFAKMLRRLIREDIDLHFDLHPDLWATKADPSHIEQVLINLVVNARDAISKVGRITVSTSNVEVVDPLVDIDSASIHGSYVLLSVRDDGCGMAKDLQQQIFAPFYTTKENGQGTGLGLSLVHGIVNQYAGHIRIESTLDQGTTFFIYLPPCPDLSENEPKREQQELVGGTETILLAEDNEEVRLVLTSTLKHLGYQPIEAENGFEALRLFSENPDRVDLLLTDVIMPGMGGEELTKKLHAIRPDLPVIYMSGHLISNSGLSENVCCERNFITKPFYPAHIANKIRSILDGQPQRQSGDSKV